MNHWDEDANDDAWTGALPRQQVGHPRVPRPVIMVVMAVIILVVLATVSYGYVGLNWFRPNPSTSFAQAPTATATQARQPNATTGLAPSPTTTTPPTMTSHPQPTPSPTVAPSPTAKPSPAILAVTPNTYYFNNCTPSGRASYICTFTLSNSSSASPLAWTATASNSHGLNATSSLSSTSGTLPKSGITTVSLFLSGETGVCSVIGTTVYLQFTGPANAVTVTVTC